MAAWTRHRKEVSIDSVMSDFSGIHLGRPGLGDKMFNNAADHIGQQIVTWVTSVPGLSPLKESSSSSVSNITPPSSMFHWTHNLL